MPDDPATAREAARIRIADFDNSYARLPDRFHARLDPTPVASPRLIRLNHALADELRLDFAGLSDEDLAQIFSGNRVPAGAEPIAMAYSGHQFGGFSPQLGDGRAILLGEVIDRGGRRRDLQLKGSGPTPFSRRGDGRAALGPVLREYIVSEAFAALGVPTTRSLAAVSTGEQVYRETPLPGAVVTRVASSHIRVGTFQFFASRGDIEALRLLAEHVIDRHYPECRDVGKPALALLQAVIARQAALVANWMNVGFIHGVMNTDNVSICGETIDFGPCAFLDAYDPAKVFSSIDVDGRYAFGNQPRIAQWNLARLAETLLPLIEEDQKDALPAAQEAIGAFPAQFERCYIDGLRRKLGLTGAEDDDKVLSADLLDLMRHQQADYTLTFRKLAEAVEPGIGEAGFAACFGQPDSTSEWLARWRTRLARQSRSTMEAAQAMRLANPAFIPRNHRIEQAIAAALEGDLSKFHEMVDVLARPFDDQLERARLAEPPLSSELVLQTFCGT